MGTLRFQAIEFSRDTSWSLGVDFSLRFTTAGNLELWKTSENLLVWQTNTRGDRLAMQADGNLVVYSAEGAPLWSSGTAGDEAQLIAGDDGQLAIVAADKTTTLWEPVPKIEPETTDE